MEILKFPHKALFTRCVPVNVFDTELKLLLGFMWDAMVANHGIGLAANQVGLTWRMFVMRGENDEKIFLVNPKILSSGLESANIREGCLSAPGEFVVLQERAKWVQVEYQTEDGTKMVRVFKDIYSVCAQHEMEHLEGKSHLQSRSIPKAKRIEIAKRWGFKVK